MINLYLVFNPTDMKRWYGALGRLENQAIAELDENPKRNAIGYSNLVVKNIMQQKNMGAYARYNPRYAKWKEQWGRAGGFWQLFGDLVKSITHFRVTDSRMGYKAWMGGIPPNMVDSGGKSWFGKGAHGGPKKIAMYAYVMEYGGDYGRGGKHPARPVFGPTATEYQNVFWWREFENSRIRIKNKWR